ncbi:MAG: hypothetical protein V1763_03325 [Parcubacteria group bacterium]
MPSLNPNLSPEISKSVVESTPIENEARVESAPAIENATAQAVKQSAEVAPPVVTVASTVVAAPVAKSVALQKIENILADDLDALYKELPPEKQREFKQKGEETATRIDQMLHSAKINIRKIIALIKDWLKLIPGVNKYFLEQEAKIKCDELLEYQEKNQK